MHFFLAAAWGLIVLLGLFGWGSVVIRFLRCAPVSWGVTAVTGFAFSTFVGGLLGLAHLILPAVVIGFVLVGNLFGIAMTIRDGLQLSASLARARKSLGVLTITLGAILICLAGWRYLGSVTSLDVNPADDPPAYLVFPVKMLQTGQFAPDPFSERRMAGLGGQPWSQAMVLSLFNVVTTHLFDQGIAFLLLLIVAGSWLRAISLSWPITLSILLVLTLHYPNIVNCTSFITVSCLYLTLFVVLSNRPINAWEVILIALIVAAACSLKAPAIPFIGCALTIYFVWMSVETRSWRPILIAIGIAGLTASFLFPWMLAMRASSGTLLYPLLGHGYSRLPPLLHTMPKHTAILLVLLSMVPVAVAGLIVVCLYRDHSSSAWNRLAFIFFVGMAPVIFIVGVNTGGAGWLRYSQPFLYGLIPLPLAAIWIAAEQGRSRTRFLQISAIGLSLLLILLPLGWLRPEGKANILAVELQNIREGLQGRTLVSQRDIEDAMHLQYAVPPGETILARLNYPMLMNFVRNPVYITDHPGLAGPPGQLDTNDPSKLDSYLLTHSVRYVAYSYDDEAEWFQTISNNLKSPYGWDKISSIRAIQFRDMILELKKNHRVVYDDGRNFVIDLKL